MKRVAQPAFPGARGLDCVSVITPAFAQWMVDNDFDFAMRYLGSLTSAEIDVLHAHGRAVMPVCFADKFDGFAAIAELVHIEMPTGVTVWADIESVKTLDAKALAERLNEGFAIPLRAAHYDPGGYFANDQPLTANQMGSLILDRYCRGDVIGVPEPWIATGPIGFCMEQISGNTTSYRGKPTPAPIDIDFIREDFRGRVPTWCVGIPDLPEAA